MQPPGSALSARISANYGSWTARGHFATLGEGRRHPLAALDDQSRLNVLLQACVFADQLTTRTMKAGESSFLQPFGER